jgi:hypothetical protein
MLKTKKIVPLFFTTLLASCGGDNGISNVSSGQTKTAGTAPAIPTSSSPTTIATGSAATAAGTGTVPAAPTPAPTPAPVATDQQFKGYLQTVANQVVYIRTNRVIYLPVSMSEFESDRGIVDIAPGSKVAHIDGLESFAASQRCNVAIDGTCAIQPAAVAPAAPIAAFGIRIDKALQPSAPGQQVANQTVVGRIAFDLTERNEAPGVGTNEVPEIMRFIIDDVQMTTDENGRLASASVLTGGQIHVYARTAAGAEVHANIPAPPGTVRLLPLTEVPDHGIDTSSVFLLMDLETGFSQAGSALNILQNIAGHFSMHISFSSFARLVRPAAPAANGLPAVGQTDLVGESITVDGQAPVTGAGINGNAWIRMFPPQ